MEKQVQARRRSHWAWRGADRDQMAPLRRRPSPLEIRLPFVAVAGFMGRRVEIEQKAFQAFGKFESCGQ
jgi:hypothetical protein